MFSIYNRRTPPQGYTLPSSLTNPRTLRHSYHDLGTILRTRYSLLNFGDVKLRLICYLLRERLRFATDLTGFGNTAYPTG